MPIYPKKRFKKHVCLVTRKGFRLEGTTATKKKGKENQPTCKTFKTFKTLGFQTFWSLIYNIIVNSNMGIRLLDFSDFCFFSPPGTSNFSSCWSGKVHAAAFFQRQSSVGSWFRCHANEETSLCESGKANTAQKETK